MLGLTRMFQTLEKINIFLSIIHCLGKTNFHKVAIFASYQDWNFFGNLVMLPRNVQCWSIFNQNFHSNNVVQWANNHKFCCKRISAILQNFGRDCQLKPTHWLQKVLGSDRIKKSMIRLSNITWPAFTRKSILENFVNNSTYYNE